MSSNESSLLVPEADRHHLQWCRTQEDEPDLEATVSIPPRSTINSKHHRVMARPLRLDWQLLGREFSEISDVMEPFSLVSSKMLSARLRTARRNDSHWCFGVNDADAVLFGWQQGQARRFIEGNIDGV